VISSIVKDITFILLIFFYVINIYIYHDIINVIDVTQMLHVTYVLNLHALTNTRTHIYIIICMYIYIHCIYEWKVL